MYGDSLRGLRFAYATRPRGASMVSKHAHKKNSPFQVALIAMPWQIFNRPSIQLGALKAYIEKYESPITVRTFHPYLEVAKEIGTDIYHQISQNIWGCEALYVPILFPQQLKQAKEVFDQTGNKSLQDLSSRFEGLQHLLTRQLELFVESLAHEKCDLIGFSVCFNQLFSSLAAAKLIKESLPEIPLVFGGSSCIPGVTASLMSLFPQIDYFIHGEGETPLAGLCRYLMQEIDELPDAVSANDQRAKEKEHAAFCQLDTLRGLPVPDFGPYFKEMHHWFADRPFIPEVPVEFSRGCWWGKCTFCNLNTQWCGYRMKNSDQMVNEIIALSEKHACLDFSFTDNALPVKESARFFEKISEYRRDLRFFAEIRVGQGKEILEIFKKGGLATVQAGIEALSNSLLKKMGKGVRVIENIALLKDAFSSNIEIEGNIITEFPGSTQDEVDETLFNLDFVMPFRPLSKASFFLGVGSPVEREPQKYGIRAITHHPNIKKLFPGELHAKVRFLILDYRGDRKVQQNRWRPVVKKLALWKRFHENRDKSGKGQPALAYRDGSRFLIIRQELPDTVVLHHRLRGLSRDVYLYCDQIRTVDDLTGRFPGLTKEKLVHFLDSMVAKKLMFAEDDHYLSLAVHKKV